MKPDEIIKENLKKGFSKVEGIQYVLLGNGHVKVSDVSWVQDDKIAHSGIAFSPAEKFAKVGELFEKDANKPIVALQPVVIIKASNIESLLVVREAIDRAIEQLKTNQSNK